MMQSQPSRGMIGLRTALILYALLVTAAYFTLKGVALAIAVVIVLALAAKSIVHHLRGRIE
ncbi:MAG: hypothetical protein JO138_12220 [Acidobacteriaceae bacterium]|nr:hypothetical protein [Acidobacteriaceae bacterium]